MKNQIHPMLATAQAIISKTAKRMNLPQKFIDRLLEPNAIHEVNFLVQLNNQDRRLFKGYRIQHNNALGPYKGGIRFHPNVSKEEVQALATLMSIKCAVAGLPYGGGKGGLIVDPKHLSAGELEKLSRAYIRSIASVIGPETDVPAPDVNTNPQIMEWMVDEYVKQIQNSKLKVQSLNPKSLNYLRATFTGKLVGKGGTLGRTEATGRGGVIILQALLAKLSSKFKVQSSKLSIAVQGFGNVGYYFAKIANQEGFKVVAISDSKGAVYVKDGLDPSTTMKCKKERGTVAGCYCRGSVCDIRFGKTIANDELLELPVDILVPAALEDAINEDNMRDVKAKIIIEMANGPITEEAYEYLTKKGAIIVPDVLANSGGVTVSYLEWYQNMHNQKWSEEKVNKKLKEMMEKAFKQVWLKSVKISLNQLKLAKLDLKQAAFEVAIERIVKKW